MHGRSPVRARSRFLASEVAERLVTVAHCLAPSRLSRAAREAMSLRRMAGDPVERGAQHLGGVKTLGVEGLVHQELVHDELVHRHLRDALNQSLEALVE